MHIRSTAQSKSTVGVTVSMHGPFGVVLRWAGDLYRMSPTSCLIEINSITPTTLNKMTWVHKTDKKNHNKADI